MDKQEAIDRMYLAFDERIGPAIRAERIKQIQKWGDDDHDPEKFLTILVEEVGEVARAVLDRNYAINEKGNYAEELIQVAAVCVRALEGYYRKLFEEAKAESIAKYSNAYKKLADN